MKPGRKYSKELREYLIKLHNEKTPYKEIIKRVEAEFGTKIPHGSIGSAVYSYNKRFQIEKDNHIYLTKEQLQSLIDNKPIQIRTNRRLITINVTTYCCTQYSSTIETKYGKRLLKASKYCPFCGKRKEV